jgi:hypothetical protein
MEAPTHQQQEAIARHHAEMAAAQSKMQNLLTDEDWSGITFNDRPERVSETNSPAESNQIVHLDLESRAFAGGDVTNLAGGKPFRVQGTLASTNGPLGVPALVLDGQTLLRSEVLPSVKSPKGWVFSAWLRRDGPGKAVVFSTANFSVPASAEQFGEGFQLRITDSGALDVRLSHRWPGYSIQLRTRETLPETQWRHVVVASDGSTSAKGLRILIDGEECFRDVIHDDLISKIGISGPAEVGGSDEKGAVRFQGAIAGIEITANPDEVGELAGRSRELSLRYAAETAASKRSPAQVALLRADWLEKHQPAFAVLAAGLRKARAAVLAIESDSPSTMVMRELPDRRPTFLLSRGQYDAPREAVEPGVPEFVLPFPKNALRNRLGLAQWLTDPSNPLTARVVVNRFWQALFGTGIVKTSENFGYQGEVPSHPELLDWMAVDFVESGWDVKRLLRLMVSSATYRQDSRSTDELNERDPENRLLSHGPRQRLTGEMLRDQVLFVSGLLYDDIGGPPVFPYQPTNLYKGIVVAADYPGTSYTESTGDGLYRRSLYTFWKRTVPHPSLSTFDVPDREVCVARRPKTNTPLQALALMNDTIQLEASRKFAERMLLNGGESAGERINYAFRLATARRPKSDESKALRSLLERRMQAYRKDPSAAKAFLSVGASKSDPKLDPVELAAYANLASLILNLDETITRN